MKGKLILFASEIKHKKKTSEENFAKREALKLKLVAAFLGLFTLTGKKPLGALFAPEIGKVAVVARGPAEGRPRTQVAGNRGAIDV